MRQFIKQMLLSFNLTDRQEQYTRRSNILIYGVEEDKETTMMGKRSCSKKQMSSKSVSMVMIYREYIG